VKIDAEALRAEAERRFAEKERSAPKLSAVDTLSFQHELGVHQIELEMQNEELRRTQNELERSREKYLDLYDLAPVGYAVLNDKGLIQEANLTLTSCLGVTRNALVGSPLRRFVDPASQETYSLHLRRLFETGEPSSFEVGMVMEDGTSFWGRVDANVHADNDDRATGHITLTDVTELKRRNEAALMESHDALQESEERFRTLYDRSVLGLYRTTPGGQIVMANSALCTMLGYSSFEDLRQRNLEEQGYHPDYSRADFKRELDEKGVIIGIESRWKRSDGEYIWVRESARAACDESGRVLYYDGTVEDMTERKQAEIAIREAEGRFRFLAEATSEGVAISENGTIIDCNPQFAALLGNSIQETIGRSLLEFVAPEFVGAVRERIRTGHVERHEAVALRCDGSRFPVEADARIAAYNGRTVRIAVFRDLTDQRRSEAEIHQLTVELEQKVRERTAQLEAVNSELEAFSYSVSHDLRAPLRAIEGFSAMVVQRHGDQVDAEAKRLLGVVRANARRMARLIDDLLSFSRSGRSEMSVNRLNMKEMARSAFEEVIADPEARRKIDFRVGELPWADGDGTLVRQVWINLLSNAAKFSAGKEPSVIEVEGSVEAGFAVYRVRDNGAGFDMTYADKLFGVFQRLHGMTEFEGTGIGLALVKRIVTRHSGRVWAEGEVGKGARFSFSLPVKPRSGISTSWRKLVLPPGTPNVS